MTPEYKAQELFDKYWKYLRANLLNDEEAKEDAKQCVLIMADSILTNSTKLLSFEEIYFWNEVKKEIEKL
jgi:hypothetical protein